MIKSKGGKEMKKVLVAICLLVLCFSYCLAEQGEEAKPYNVFIGIQWGDNIEIVKDMFGKGKENHMDNFTFIRYENAKLGEMEPNYIMFGFVDERLFTISATFILPKDTFYQNMINAFTQELGEETAKEEYKYIWDFYGRNTQSTTIVKNNGETFDFSLCKNQLIEKK